ncbi:unnamed protein product [Bursaphelenchus xylophilus]|uniref:non-specific serine/threonine protein kinase n=1 Tax=Bursaphelenchus xylophilus TaxID=6326 RepID=A0A7I8XFZ0_BURXY|nr:unnamed protein product [Bursaphelenchus xylophilus]CAG9123892.1 unnamed protein product [Bursaphelenchus xylophilus]
MSAESVIRESVEFPPGKIISGRWKIISQIGHGGCAIVYQVQDVNQVNLKAALKVESNYIDNGVLKMEADVLKKLGDRKYTIKLLHSGKRQDYSFLVLTLCGPDLDRLRERRNTRTFSESTILRVGVHCLYAIKQLHEIGYVHRDIKPSNMVIGAEETDRRLIYLIDYGMVRAYAVQVAGKWKFKKPRYDVALRGTIRYCSVNVHRKKEQGRVDDLWSLVYLLAELQGPLPWYKCKSTLRLPALKEEFDDEKNKSLKNLECLREIASHLRSCSFADRPNYMLVYLALMRQIRAKGFRFKDPYDWEKDDHDFGASNFSESSNSEGASKAEKEPSVETNREERTQDCHTPPRGSDESVEPPKQQSPEKMKLCFRP